MKCYEVEFRGHKIKYTSDESFWQRLSSDSWESNTFTLLEKFIKPGKVFIDCGAWNGVLSIYAAMLGATVYSIEPDAFAFEDLTTNVSANQLFNVHVYKLAIAGEAGIKEFYARSNNWGTSESSLIPGSSDSMRTVVKTQTIKMFVEENNITSIGFIKIDTEGGEALFINDDFMQVMINCGLPPMFISFHPKHYPLSDCLKIYNILSKHYSFLNEDDFLTAMKNHNADHSFLLTKH